MTCIRKEEKAMGLQRDLFAKKTVRAIARSYQAVDLNSCLSRWDLIFIRLGATVGGSAFTLPSSIAYLYGGPSVVVSFFVAGLLAVLTSLCYAEFGGRIPQCGSAYTYTCNAVVFVPLLT